MRKKAKPKEEHIPIPAYVTPRQKQLLELFRERFGSSAAWTIRQALDEYFERRKDDLK